MKKDVRPWLAGLLCALALTGCGPSGECVETAPVTRTTYTYIPINTGGVMSMLPIANGKETKLECVAWKEQ